MTLAIPQEGRTRIRDAVSAIVSHLVISTDSTAFSDGDTTASPGGGTEIVKAVTSSTVDANTSRHEASVTGADGTGQFPTVALLTSSSSADLLTRYLRTNPIGIDADDEYTIAQDLIHSDAG